MATALGYRPFAGCKHEDRRQVAGPLCRRRRSWAAHGFVDTKIGVTLAPEVDLRTENDIYGRVQA